jgi:hypothetical protein
VELTKHGARWRRVFSLLSQPVYCRGGRPLYQLGGPQNQSGDFGVEKNLLPVLDRVGRS